MPKSRFVSAARLRRLIVYLGVAFVVVLGVGALVPPGSLRNGLVALWVVGFPIGAWKVFGRR
jgi:hypothetical protein